MSDTPLARPPLTDAQRIITRAWAMLQNGTARGWSLAMSDAADTMKSSEAPHDAAEGDDRDGSSTTTQARNEVWAVQEAV